MSILKPEAYPAQLESPQVFHQWWHAELVSGKSNEDVLRTLRGEASAIGLCRQMIVAYHGGIGKARTDLIERCLDSTDARVQIYAKALDAYMQIAWHDAPDGAFNSPASALLPSLIADLRKLETLPTSKLSREVSCAVNVAIGVGHFLQGNVEGAQACASEAWYWADRLDAPFCKERARSLQVSTLIGMGQVGEALTMLEAPNGAEVDQTTATRVYSARVQAHLLSQVGRYEEAVSLLEHYNLGTMDEDTSLRSELLRTRLLWATGGTSEEVSRTFDASEVEGQISKSLQKLLLAACEAPWGKGFSERQSLISEALAHWSMPRQPQTHSWGRGIGIWLQGVASLWLDRAELAEVLLSDWQELSPQSLDLNALIAAAKLEVALSLKCPEVSVQKPLEQLRSVFYQARSRSVASPEGLAYRVAFWHPLAAAFSAIAPGGIREFRDSVNSVLAAGVRNRVHDMEVPPALATELALRALGFASSRHVNFVQADVGRDRKKRDAFRQQRGKLQVYRPVLSAASLIYGLVKLGERERGRAVYAEYGVVPQSTAEYRMHAVLQNVDRATDLLLKGEIPVSTFCYAVLADEALPDKGNW